MLENKNLFDAITEIEDNYILDAENFRKNGYKTIDFSQNKCNRSSYAKVEGLLASKVKRWAAVAVIAVILTGTTAYGAVKLVQQLHIQAYHSIEELMQKHNIAIWDSAIPYESSTFEEDGFTDVASPKALIDILTTGEEKIEETYTIENGTKDSKWLRKLSGMDEVGYYEAYDYAKLSSAFEEQNINFDMSYIEKNYPFVAGEYGCDIHYTDISKENCLRYRMFSGYMNEDGDFVSVQYGVDYENTNMDPYILFDGDVDVRYYITEDDVSVFLKQGIGTKGGTLTTAQVYTEHGHLYVGMYGTFEKEEVENILNSLKIAEGMGIETK